MTEGVLNQYRRLIREAEDLQNRINKLYDREITTTHSMVRGSSKCFPFTEFHFGVWVDDPEQVADRDKMIAIYQDRLKYARSEAMKIEQFIKDISDSELRQICEYRYIDGMKLMDIGGIMSMDRSGIGKKIRAHLNFPAIPTIPDI